MFPILETTEIDRKDIELKEELGVGNFGVGGLNCKCCSTCYLLVGLVTSDG